MKKKNLHLFDQVGEDELRHTLQGMYPLPDDEDTSWQNEVKAKLEATPQYSQCKPSIHHNRRVLWFTLAAAALILLVMMFGIEHYISKPSEPVVAEGTIEAPSVHKTDEPALAQKEVGKDSVNTETPSKRVKAVVPVKSLTPKATHAATSNQAVDTLHYQAPGRMEEFIAKIANYNHVKEETLACSDGKNDSTVVCKAYMFADNDEVDLFARLLQAVSWYDNKAPGYLLNYSHQQFFFCLNDVTLGLKYMWIAERMNGKILLYSTHSPIDMDASADCFKNYCDKLIHTNIHQKPTVL